MAINWDEVFEKAKETTISTGNVIGGAVDEVVDASKVKIAKTKVNYQLKNAYASLGKAVHDTYKTGEDTGDLQMALMDEIEHCLSVLKKIDIAAANIKRVPCPTCKWINPPVAAFCSKCGVKLIEDEPATTSIVVVEE